MKCLSCLHRFFGYAAFLQFYSKQTFLIHLLSSAAPHPLSCNPPLLCRTFASSGLIIALSHGKHNPLAAVIPADHSLGSAAFDHCYCSYESRIASDVPVREIRCSSGISSYRSLTFFGSLSHLFRFACQTGSAFRAPCHPLPVTHWRPALDHTECPQSARPAGPHPQSTFRLLR